MLFLLLLLLISAYARAHGPMLGLELHHRFSKSIHNWAPSMDETKDPPQEGTPEYYATLIAHDRALLHRRGLAEGPPDLTFGNGNQTIKLSALGFLHYAYVELGTPNVTFLVALDTGSELFWVPCDCKNCSPTYDDRYNLSFNIFDSKASSTSKKVPCNSSLCENQDLCSSQTDHNGCPFKLRYVDNSTVSGVLLQDVLHFITDDSHLKPMQVNVTFGCGQNQPDTFNFGTPNGLLGLGPTSISVPSTLAAVGLISNSFSMCFSPNGHGRIRFGDKGSPDQFTTPFYPNIPTYIVSINQILVKNDLINASVNAYFDTGTSFTLLSDPVYSELAKRFDNLVKRRRITINQLPLDYCYEIGANEKVIDYPRLTMIMKGGNEFPVLQPVVVLAEAITGNLVGFCLGIIKSSKINIIGQNFMTGYKVVFDRDKFVLGWTPFDCYKNQESEAASGHQGYNFTSNAPELAPVSESPQRSSTSDGGHGFRSSVTPLVPSFVLRTLASQCLLLILFSM